MADPNFGAMTPEKQAAIALLKDRGVPMTTQNLASALTVVYRGLNTNDTRPSDIPFELEAPAPKRSAGGARQPQAKKPQVDPASVKPSEQPTDPLAGNGGSGDGDGMLPWLIGILGTIGGGNVLAGKMMRGMQREQGAKAGGNIGSEVGSRVASPQPNESVPRLTDQSTRVVGNGNPQITDQRGDNPLLEFDSRPRPQARSYPAPQAPADPSRVGAPQAMSMFSDAYNPEGADKLSRSLMMAAESGGLGSGHVDALRSLANLVGAGPQEGVLDLSREAIGALQDLPYVRQQQIMNLMRDNPILSPEFNSYLQPRINKSGEVLKGVLKRGAGRG